MRDLSFLTGEDRQFIEEKTEEFRLSHQDRRQLGIIAADLRRWDEGGISQHWREPENPALKGKDRRKAVMNAIKAVWNDLKNRPKSYDGFDPCYRTEGRSVNFSDKPVESPILGRCPVASEKTRCCNLQTLDAVMGCGFDCSYCSIRTFYHTDDILFHKDLEKKLDIISKSLDPEKKYHIGTGQSSDSLMWGNRDGMLDRLFDFAENNPNVILELKSKSANIGGLINRRIPANVLTSWSLNTDVIIENEEHLTANLEQRLEAAEKIAGKGALIGFHFHPMVVYDGWREDYGDVFEKLKKRFSSDIISHISFGTLTFIKPVIKELQKKEFKSKILQMPMEEIAGKLSYPVETKLELFKFAYDSLSSWHGELYFYLCMEDIRLWKPVFGYEYASNEEFEKAMINSYFKKVEAIWNRQ